MEMKTAYRYPIYARYDDRMVFVTAYKRLPAAKNYADNSAAFYRFKDYAADCFIIFDRRDNKQVYSTAD